MSTALFTAPFAAPSAFKADADVLPRCLLLAVLLHIWLALMVGTKPGLETAAQGAWGSLRVTLLGPGGNAASGEAAPDAAPLRDDGPPGQAASPRYGGQLRREAPPADSGPGAQSLGRWKAQEVPPDASRPDDAAPIERGVAAPEPIPAVQLPAPPAPAQEPVATAPNPPSLALPPSVANPNTAVLALREEAAASPAPRRLQAVEAVKPTTALGTAVAPLPARIEALPAEVPPPMPTVAPVPEPSLRTLEAPPVARPKVALEALRAPVSPKLSDGIAPVPSAAVMREPPAPLPPTPAPALAAAPELAPAPAPAPAPAVQPAAAPAPAPALAPAPLTRGDPRAEPVPGQRASPGAPTAGARVGHDVATPPSASASAPPPPLNLSLPRSGLAASPRQGPGVLGLLAAPPERKTAMEKAVEEASRDDCRKAHGDKGLLAAIPLAVDSLRNKGCKW